SRGSMRSGETCRPLSAIAVSLPRQGSRDGRPRRARIQAHLRATSGTGVVDPRCTLLTGHHTGSLHAGDGEVAVSLVPGAERPEDYDAPALMLRQYPVKGSEETGNVDHRSVGQPVGHGPGLAVVVAAAPDLVQGCGHRVRDGLRHRRAP